MKYTFPVISSPLQRHHDENFAVIFARSPRVFQKNRMPKVHASILIAAQLMMWQLQVSHEFLVTISLVIC